MRFDIVEGDFASNTSDLILIFSGQMKIKNEFEFLPLQSFENLDKELNGVLSQAIKTSDFKGKCGELLDVYPENSKKYKWIVVAGLGDTKKFESNELRRVVGSFSKKYKNKIESISILLPPNEVNLDEEISAQAVTEGFLLGKYSFDKYKKVEEKKKVERVTLLTTDKEKAKRGLEIGEIYSNATNLTRDLVNEQPAIATPAYLAEVAMDIAKKNKDIKCQIINEKEAEKLGMNAFLGIARASSSNIPPKFIHIEYTPFKKSGKEKLALVGKGITFDSGGMNVKPGDHMKDMKIDMGGAAIVLGIFSQISKIRPEFPVMGLIAATPNLISSTSIVPGDVVKAMNGKTIEILNTDAEGRVTMADTLSYAASKNATTIIDFATLTGAAVVALGEDITALFSNDDKLKEEILSAAKKNGEKMWELPLEKSYKKQNKSEVADIANISHTRYGGTITAALFLEEFVKEGTSWAHLDIAGPTYSSKPTEIGPKGATGHGVRTVLSYLKK